MGAALGMFALVIGVTLWSLIGQDRAIAKFTKDVQIETEIAEGTAEDVAALRAKLDAFSQRASGGEQGVELSLSMEELNLIVAHTESGKDYRGMVYFTGTREIEGEPDPESGGRSQARQLVANVCVTMNKLKFWEKRYLIGEMEFDLRKVPAGLDLIVTGINVPDLDVPAQFVGNFANWHWLSPFHEDPKMGPVFKAIREAKILDDRVVLTTGEKAGDG